MNRQECELYNDGKCTRTRYSRTCEVESVENLFEYEERVQQKSMLECCKAMSPYGNCLYTITDKDIEALKEGKWLALGEDEEYGNFIRYIKE